MVITTLSFVMLVSTASPKTPAAAVQAPPAFIQKAINGAKNKEITEKDLELQRAAVKRYLAVLNSKFDALTIMRKYFGLVKADCKNNASLIPGYNAKDQKECESFVDKGTAQFEADLKSTEKKPAKEKEEQVSALKEFIEGLTEFYSDLSKLKMADIEEMKKIAAEMEKAEQPIKK